MVSSLNIMTWGNYLMFLFIETAYASIESERINCYFIFCRENWVPTGWNWWFARLSFFRIKWYIAKAENGDKTFPPQTFHRLSHANRIFPPLTFQVIIRKIPHWHIHNLIWLFPKQPLRFSQDCVGENVCGANICGGLWGKILVTAGQI